MKAKLFIFILTSVIIVTALLGLTSCTQGDTGNTSPVHTADSPETEEPFVKADIPLTFGEDVPETKSITLANGTELTLSLEKVDEDDKSLPTATYYIKKSGHFTFNTDWQIVRWSGGFETSVYDRSKKITEEEALTAAEEFLVAFFGEDFNDSFDEPEVKKDSGSHGYCVTYYSFYGKDGFIKEETFSVNVTIRGKVSDFSMRNPLSFRNLDPKILENTSRADVEAFIDNVLNEVAILEQEADKEPVMGYEDFDIVSMVRFTDGENYYIGLHLYVYTDWINNSEHITYREPHDHEPDETRKPRFIVTMNYPLTSE